MYSLTDIAYHICRLCSKLKGKWRAASARTAPIYASLCPVAHCPSL